MTPDVHRTIDAVWRMESARLIAGLTRVVHDVGLAEDLAQDALVAALEQWPESGVPDKPGAWLMTAAKRRAIDLQRHHQLADRKHEEIGRDLDSLQDARLDALHEALDDEVGDDLLRLIFMSCHPVLSMEARVAPSPVVELNRAVAVGFAQGPAAGLKLTDVLAKAPSMKHYHLLPSVRGDLLAKLGRNAEAVAEFKRAADLTQNARERVLLLARAAQLS